MVKKVNKRPIEEFVRAPNNPGAVVNVDDHGLLQYREMRKRHYELHNKVTEINTIKEEVNSIKNEMSDIKLMLSQLLERSK